jgi:endonuclease/exonuclease/phosphatase family metal-dependent hydrolase
MRILTWNIACLPNRINIVGNPFKRLPSILNSILSLEPNIICLQEVFDFKIMKSLRDNLNNKGYHIHTSKPEGIISKNGLLTATLYPIEYQTEIDYSMYTGAEYLIKKGMLTTHITHNQQTIQIHNTHLQSNSIYTMDKQCCQVRQKQKQEVITYISQNLNDLHILCGDLNDDFNTPEHQNFLHNLPFPNYTTNPQKLITFPKYEEQLDYIILSQLKDCNYTKIKTLNKKVSDHDILIADLI